MKTELSKEILEKIRAEAQELYGSDTIEARKQHIAFIVGCKEYALKYQQEKQKLDEAVELLERACNLISDAPDLQTEINQFLTSHKSGGENLG